MARPVTRRFVLMIYVLLGIFLVSLAVPLIRYQVAPNSWYGFRVPQTLRDPKVWYSANARAGWLLLMAGVAVSLVAVGLYPARRRLKDAAYAVWCSSVLLGIVLATLVMTWLYLRSVVPSPPNDAMHPEQSVMRFMVIVYVFIGLMLVGLAVPLVRGRVRPNRWYGFRVQETLQDADVWYAVNSYSGRLLLSLGVIVLAFLRLKHRLDGGPLGWGAFLFVDDMKNLALAIPLFTLIGLAGLFTAHAWESGAMHAAGVGLFIVSGAIVFFDIKHVFDRMDMDAS